MVTTAVLGEMTVVVLAVVTGFGLSLFFSSAATAMVALSAETTVVVDANHTTNTKKGALAPFFNHT